RRPVVSDLMSFKFLKTRRPVVSDLMSFKSTKSERVASESQGQEDLLMPDAIASFGAKAESVVSANSPEQITAPRTLSPLTTPL
ncbi:hypothetical protein QVN60_12550, partial [Yersinia aleksiciae]